MDKLVIFKREITERRDKGFFASVSEFEHLTNYNNKQLNEFISKINCNKKIKFDIYRVYDFRKLKDRRQFIIDCINETQTGKNSRCDFLFETGERILKDI